MTAILGQPAELGPTDAEMVAVVKRLLGRSDLPAYFTKIAPAWVQKKEATRART